MHERLSPPHSHVDRTYVIPTRNHGNGNIVYRDRWLWPALDSREIRSSHRHWSIHRASPVNVLDLVAGLRSTHVHGNWPGPDYSKVSWNSGRVAGRPRSRVLWAVVSKSIRYECWQLKNLAIFVRIDLDTKSARSTEEETSFSRKTEIRFLLSTAVRQRRVPMAFRNLTTAIVTRAVITASRPTRKEFLEEYRVGRGRIDKTRLAVQVRFAPIGHSQWRVQFSRGQNMLYNPMAHSRRKIKNNLR